MWKYGGGFHQETPHSFRSFHQETLHRFRSLLQILSFLMFFWIVRLSVGMNTYICSMHLSSNLNIPVMIPAARAPFQSGIRLDEELELGRKVRYFLYRKWRLQVWLSATFLVNQHASNMARLLRAWPAEVISRILSYLKPDVRIIASRVANFPHHMQELSTILHHMVQPRTIEHWQLRANLPTVLATATDPAQFSGSPPNFSWIYGAHIPMTYD